MANKQQGVASVLAVALLLAAVPTVVHSIGVCYGVIGNNLPSASDVVQLYQSNGIDSMRIYFADTNALQAFSGSNIGLIMDIGNDNLAAFASDPGAAAAWVQNNVKAFPGVNFRYIAVGNEVAGGDTQNILPAMRNIDSALSAAGLGNIKASTAVQSGVTGGFPPSQGTFSSDASSYMTPSRSTSPAPDGGNAYQNLFDALVDTFYSALEKAGAGNAQIDINYALFTSSGTVVQDGGNAYQNLFDALVDTFYSALEKAGAGNYLASTGAPLLANVYPYFSYIGNQAQIDINYALFTSSGTVVQDGGNAYQNLFDALVDTFYSALEKAGAGNVKIVVSESGWPSAGGEAATADNARTYNQNLINHVGQGTPKRPGGMEAYIFAMFNENQKGGAETERHFGLFNPDKSPAYQMNF
ncbi:hypothetical protein QOZ80_5AG0391160 [Eleusine coracana subsp. coracana]|nr:hypothetical protein QOZ80_5AG0391160 [Eleusine coracana subsp. coracana]